MGGYNSQMNSLETLFWALSDPTRLRILHFLSNGELCVGDLVELLNVPQPKVSRHLNHLREAGLVNVRRSGLWAFYSREEEMDQSSLILLNALDQCWELEPEYVRDHKKAFRLMKKGGCCPELDLETRADLLSGKNRRSKPA